jgi:hypothetical protein
MRHYLKRISEELASEKSIKLEDTQCECKECVEFKRLGITPLQVLDKIERLEEINKENEKKLRIEEEFKKNYVEKSRENIDRILADFLVVLKDKTRLIEVLKCEEKVSMKDQETFVEDLNISESAPKRKLHKSKTETSPKEKSKANQMKARPVKPVPLSKKEIAFNPGQFQKRPRTRKARNN